MKEHENQQNHTKKKKNPAAVPLLIGWHEWCMLPQLNIPAIKVKIDTGAKTSALHAFNIKSYHKKGIKYVRFDIHPIQRNNIISRQCHAVVVDERFITSSNGHKERRFVIYTQLSLGEKSWGIELTLSNRDPLKFRMLLGREAMKNNIRIDPKRHSLVQRLKSRELLALYNVKTKD